tara:strand:+ start:29 stop:238 length:210 start_codon:yes stop_codon:yes gene_type:complete
MIPLMGGALAGVAKTLIISFFSEKLILRTLFGSDRGGGVLGYVSRKTTNDLDDEVVENMRVQLTEQGKL